MDLNFSSDFKKKTLEWAASLSDEHPSERVEFAKALVSTFSSDEIRRLRSLLNNRKNRLKQDDQGDSKRAKIVSSSSSEPHSAAVSSSDAAVSGEVEVPWWTKYDMEDFVAFDTEQLTKVEASGRNRQHVATIDVVDMNLKPIYSTTVYHKPDSIKVSSIWKELTGFTANTFNNPSFPTENQVKDKIDELFRDKVVITCGGVNDYLALDKEINDFDHFDLQMHWYWEGMDEFGNNQRHGHKLKSLAKYYLNKDVQSGRYSSLEDAKITMELFKIYKQIKLADDANNVQQRVNTTHPYNEIPVLKDAVREKYKNRRRN